MREIYVSVDIEADGPIPGQFSMLSMGAVAVSPDGKLLQTFSENLHTLPNASQDPETMAWWAKHPDAWRRCREAPENPHDVMARHVHWLKGLPAKPVFVAYPASFDFMFVYWYLIKFAGESPYSFSALDMKSFAMGLLGTSFEETSQVTMPPEWLSSRPPLTHVALEDAIDQALLFRNMLKNHAKKR